MAYLFRHRKLLPRRNVEKIPSTFIRRTWEYAKTKFLRAATGFQVFLPMLIMSGAAYTEHRVSDNGRLSAYFFGSVFTPWMPVLTLS